MAVVLAYVGVGTKIPLSLQTPNQKPNQVNFAVIISQDGALIIGGFERENDSCAEMMMVAWMLSQRSAAAGVFDRSCGRCQRKRSCDKWTTPKMLLPILGE